MNLQSIRKNSNLTRTQTETINKLQQNPHTITLLTDKNLGPVIMDRQEYINRVFTDHLLDTNTYKRLSKEEAEKILADILEYLQYTFENPSSSVQNSLSNQDIRYFSRALHETNYRIPTFYGLIKIHKQPWKIRPVVSCCGSLLARLSTWVDFHLQKLKKFIPSYIKDSEDLQRQLTSLRIPPNTRIFTCDAISMYTNIDVDHSILIIKTWLQTFQHELPPNFPSSFLVTAITVIMKNNVFSFGDTHWLQRTGTAMGTPCACMLATIYFSFHERTSILPKYSDNILFYRRFINDVICLWTCPNDDIAHSNKKFQDLQEDMNTFGLLRWEFQPLSLSTTFLDLNIKLRHPTTNNHTTNHPISFSTYQKEHNLYLYLPPHSAHPPGITRSLVHGLLRKYWIQNTKTEDFQKMAKLLFKRLAARGHPSSTLLSLFLQAATSIDKSNRQQLENTKNEQTNNTNTKTNEIFLKWKFHPKDITRKQLQHSYHHTCELHSFSAPQGFKCLHTDHGSIMKIDKLTVAYTRDRNLRDILIPSRLKNIPEYTASKLLDQLTQDIPKNTKH